MFHWTKERNLENISLEGLVPKWNSLFDFMKIAAHVWEGTSKTDEDEFWDQMDKKKQIAYITATRQELGDGIVFAEENLLKSVYEWDQLGNVLLGIKGDFGPKNLPHISKAVFSR